MRFGVILPGGTAAEQVDQAVLAEEAGWDAVFVWEAAYGVDAWSLLAAMAVRTSRVRLGTLLTPLPWRRPWKVASQVVTVDQLSEGRAILTVGLGSVATDLPETGEAVDVRQRAEMLDEGIDLIRELLVWPAAVSGQALHLRVRAGRSGTGGSTGAGSHPDLGGRRLAAAEVDAAGAALRWCRPAIPPGGRATATADDRAVGLAGRARRLARRCDRGGRDARRRCRTIGVARSALAGGRCHLVAGDPLGDAAQLPRTHAADQGPDRAPDRRPVS